jgi:anti-anti-sigma factor
MMRLNVQTDHAQLRAGVSTDINVLARMEFPSAPGSTSRPPIHLALVVDRSSSMEGEKLTLTKKAAVYFMNWLTRRDYLSVVTYNESVDLLVPHTPLTEKRATAARIESIEADGTTNLSGGWLRALSDLEAHRTPGHLYRVLLMTDGLANAGLTDPARLRDVAAAYRKKDIATTTLGFGLDFDEKLLKGIADAGGGRYHFVKEPEELAAAFQEEFGELAAIVAQNLELHVGTEETVRLTEVLSDVQVERTDRSALARFGDVRAGDVRHLLFRLRVATPSAAVGAKPLLAQLASRCDALLGTIGLETQSATLRLPVVEPEKYSSEMLDSEVRREVWLAEVARMKLIVAQQLEQGDTETPVHDLREKVKTGRKLPGIESAPFILEECERLERWIERIESEPEHDELRKELVLSSTRQTTLRGAYRQTAGIRRMRAVLSPRRREEVHDLVEGLDKELRTRNYEDERVERCKLVLRELLDNALEHGCRDRPEAVTHAECHVSDNYARLVVIDDGPGFDYESKLKEEQESALSPSRRGRGLLLINRLSNRVDYQFEGGTRAEAVIERHGLEVRTQRVRPSGFELLTEMQKESGAVVLRLAGKLDAGSLAEIEEILADLYQKGFFKLIVDLSRVPYISSSGAGVFISALNQVRDNGGNLVLVAPAANVREVFELLGLTQVFQICQTQAEATEFF